MPDLRLVARVTIEYDTNGVTEKWLKEQLQFALKEAIARGALTSSTEAEVDSWSLSIKTEELDGEPMPDLPMKDKPQAIRARPVPGAR